MVEGTEAVELTSSSFVVVVVEEVDMVRIWVLREVEVEVEVEVEMIAKRLSLEIAMKLAAVLFGDDGQV